MAPFTIKEETLKAGESFTATFNEVGGYLWDWSRKSDIALQIADERAPTSDAIGAPCAHTFTILFAKAGDYEVEFTHKRPWESRPTETVRYVLHVQP